MTGASRPLRDDEKVMLLYTTEAGGKYAWRRGTREMYDEAVRTGELWIPGAIVGGAPENERVQLAMVALCTVEEIHDFRLPDDFGTKP